jgi:Calx-beta domain-containing protein
MHLLFPRRRPSSRRTSFIVLPLVAIVGLVLAATASASPSGTTNPSSINLNSVPGSSCWFGSNDDAVTKGGFSAGTIAGCRRFSGNFGGRPGVSDEPVGGDACNPTLQGGNPVTTSNCETLRLPNDLATGQQRDYTVEVHSTQGTGDIFDVTIFQEVSPGVWMKVSEGLGGESCGAPPNAQPNCARATFNAAGGAGDFVATVSPFSFECSPSVCLPRPFWGIISTTPANGGNGGGGGGLDPPIYISNAALSEGDSLTTNATFTLTMGWAAAVPVTVNYATVDNDTATADAGSDYLPAAGTVVFAPGQLVQRITVPILGDMQREGSETFSVYLALPQPVRVGTIGDGQGIATIWNDDWGRRLSGYGSVFGAPANWLSLRVQEYGGWGTSVRYYQGSGFNFYSYRINSISFNDLTHKVEVTGTGWSSGHSVTFTLIAGDNGDPGLLDTFVLTLSDGARTEGTLGSGNFKYTG